MFFTFLKLYKWYQIAQRITYNYWNRYVIIGIWYHQPWNYNIIVPWINREYLLQNSNTNFDEDVHRMIRVLLSNTILEIKPRNVVGNKDSLQGDRSSGILINKFLEDSLRRVRATIHENELDLERSWRQKHWDMEKCEEIRFITWRLWRPKKKEATLNSSDE